MRSSKIFKALSISCLTLIAANCFAAGKVYLSNTTGFMLSVQVNHGTPKVLEGSSLMQGSNANKYGFKLSNTRKPDSFSLNENSILIKSPTGEPSIKIIKLTPHSMHGDSLISIYQTNDGFGLTPPEPIWY